MTTAIETMTDAQASQIAMSLVRSVAYSTTPPLDGNKVMAQQTLSSVVTFTAPASPVLGATCYVRLVADGTNAPVFSGFTEHGSSFGFLNTAGVINHVTFWYDGAAAYYAVQQASNVTPFAAASGYVLASDPTKLVLVYPYNLNSTITPANSAFTVTNSGGAQSVTAVVVSGQTVTLTTSRTTLATDTVSILYTVPGSNALLDNNGNAVITSSTPLSNWLARGTDHFLQISNLNTKMTEVAIPQGGWEYDATATVSNSYANGMGVSGSILPSSTDGYVIARLPSTIGAIGPMLAWQTSSATGSYTTTLAAIYADTTKSSGAWWVAAGGVATSPNVSSTTQIVAGALARLSRTGTTITAAISNDNGVTWTTIHTFAASSSTALYTSLIFSNNNGYSAIKQLVGSASVA